MRGLNSSAAVRQCLRIEGFLRHSQNFQETDSQKLTARWSSDACRDDEVSRYLRTTKGNSPSEKNCIFCRLPNCWSFQISEVQDALEKKESIMSVKSIIFNVKGQRHTPYACISNRAIRLTRSQHPRCPHTNRSAGKGSPLTRKEIARPEQSADCMLHGSAQHLFYVLLAVISDSFVGMHHLLSLCQIVAPAPFSAPCACLFTLSSGWAPCDHFNSKQLSTLRCSLENHMSGGRADFCARQRGRQCSSKELWEVTLPRYCNAGEKTRAATAQTAPTRLRCSGAPVTQIGG